MAKDLFGGLGNLGGLGGIVKGLTGLMPQDDPAVKLMTAQTEVTDLAAQEKELYAQIGRLAAERYGLESFGETADKLRLVQTNLAAAKAKLDTAKTEQEAQEKEKQEAEDACTCPSCGVRNPQGVKFCQECGSKLGAAAKTFCTSCGAELAAGTRFCGECGARQPEN